jgi:hypothetical protein
MGVLADDMIFTVRLRVGDLSADNWKDPALYAFLSEGQRHLARYLTDGALYMLASIAETALEADVAEYDLPADFLRDRALKYKSVWARRWPLSEEEALRRPGQMQPTEDNPFYIIRGTQVRFPRLTVTQDNGDAFALWYVRLPLDIAGDQEPELPVTLHNLIEDFAVARCFEGREEFGTAALMQAHVLEQVLMVNARYTGQRAFDGVPRDPRLQALTDGRDGR